MFSAGLLPGLAVSAAPTTAAAASAFALGGPFLVFLKIGTVLFGSGYVLVAVLATVGIFLPALVFVAASGPLVPRIRQSPLAGTMLDGIVIAPLALMAGAALLLFWFLVNPARREDSWTGADERQCWTDTASRAQRLVRRISEDRRQPAGRPPGGARFHRSVPGRAARLPSSAPGGRDGCGDHGLLPRLRVFARLALIITVMPSFLFSGFMFPISSMARPVQWYSYVSPPGTSWTSAGASSSRGWARYGLVPGEDERLYLKGPLPPAD